MSGSSLAEKYLSWLESQVRDGQSDQDKSYWDLLALMFEKEFVAFVGNDDNRVADAMEVRREFAGRRSDSLGPISFLEVLVALSRRLEFAAGGRREGWAWQLVTNLELHRYPDPITPTKRRRVERILETCVQRTYPPNGLGGFFPLAWTEEDQTQIELWYQMSAYIHELHPGD